MIKKEVNIIKPIYDNAKSFYNKCYEIKYLNNKNIITRYDLFSYTTLIMTLKDNKIIFYDKDINNKDIYSKTTLRHIKEYIKQKYYYLELNYKDVINWEKITKKDISKLMEVNR